MTYCVKASVVPSRAELVCWKILLRLQQDEICPAPSMCFADRHPVADRLPLRTGRFPQRRFTQGRSIARFDSATRRRQTRLDCSAGGRLAEPEIGGDVRAARGDGSSFERRSADSGPGQCQPNHDRRLRGFAKTLHYHAKHPRTSTRFPTSRVTTGHSSMG